MLSIQHYSSSFHRPPDSSAPTSISQLHGHYSVINACAPIHPFSEEQVKEKGNVLYDINGQKYHPFSQWEESWRELRYGTVTENLEAENREKYGEVEFFRKAFSVLIWYVKRLRSFSLLCRYTVMPIHLTLCVL
ncbi:hypothetical protein BKA82DRAFT_491402 [Pisolithus tinctorius]|nr:hypothetical protein BKA82DRAFT_491402 [Pisolithus tinctorius]